MKLSPIITRSRSFALNGIKWFNYLIGYHKNERPLMIGASCKESSSFRTKSGTRSTYIEWPGRPIRPLNPSTRAAGLAARPVWSARRTGTCAQKFKCQFQSFDTSPTGGTRRLLADLVTWFESETHCSRIPEKLVVNFNEKNDWKNFRWFLIGRYIFARILPSNGWDLFYWRSFWVFFPPFISGGLNIKRKHP